MSARPAVAASTPPRLAPVVLALLFAACRPDGSLPIYGDVPSFQLRDQRDLSVRRSRLDGKVWVANFMFTSCPDICPMLTTKMAALRDRLRRHREQVRYVSFSVDPATDTPEVLKRYADKHGVNHDDWLFLTGPLEDIEDVVVGGFKQAIQPLPEQEGKPPNILHGSHFVLVDGQGRIRGFYPTDEAGLREIAHDVRRLVAALEG